jgi:hypothetical protein
MSTMVIGFATEFYTLWSITEAPVYKTVNDKHIQVGTNWYYDYRQNLSINEEKAVEKAHKMFPKQQFIEIDECLKGISSRRFTRYEERALPFTVFPFGRYMGCDIATCDDAYQLNRVYSGEGAIGGAKEYKTSIPLRRRVLARTRLLELGELLRIDHTEKKWDNATQGWGEVPCKYMTKRDNIKRLDTIARAVMAPTHLDGEKVELMLTLIKLAGYESAYGYVTIATYNDEKGMIYTYKGSSKPDIATEVFTKVRATIKNSEYNGVKQALIQRVKVLG